MSGEKSIKDYLSAPNYMERKAAGFFQGVDSGKTPEWRERDSEEIAAMKRIARRTILVAAVTGLVSGALIGGAETWIRLGIFDGMDDVPWREQLPYWAAFFGFSGVVTIVEIAFLYVLALRALRGISLQAGLTLGEGDGYPELFKRALARGALEFPNPRTRLFGVDPYAYIPRWRLAAINIAYKMKVGVTSFLLRIFMRRVMARLAVRGLIPLLAVPLYAAWNALIMWRIVHEGRLRTLGPFAVENGVREVFGKCPQPDDKTVQTILQGCCEMMMRGHDAHPNFVYLLARIREEMRITDAEFHVDWGRQSEILEKLKEADQERVLYMLTLAALLGTRLNRLHKGMLRQACNACGAEFNGQALKPLRARLKEGRRLSRADLAKVWQG